MAETIAEVFIRLGTSGVGDAQKKIEGVEKSLQDLGQSAKLAFTAMNPQIIDSITAKQDELRQRFDAGSISIHEFVAELRALGQESKVALASFGQREGMAGGILSRFGLGPDAEQQAASMRSLISQLQQAGNITPEQEGQLNVLMQLEKEERQRRALLQVSQEMDQGITQSRQDAVSRAMAASDAEIESELRKTRVAVEGAEERAAAEKKTAAAVAAANRQIAAQVDRSIADESDISRRQTERAVQQQINRQSQERNTQMLRGIELTRQFETEQERFNRRLAEYNMLAASGRITTETYDRAVRHLNETFRHNQRLQSGGLFSRNAQALQQASYAAQDFAQVLDQGLGRALQASANNLGIIIPMLVRSAGLGAVLAVGFTAAATAIAYFERSMNGGKTAAERMTDEVNRLKEAITSLRTSMQSGFRMEEIISKGSVEDVQKAIDDRKEQVKIEEAVNKKSREDAQRLAREQLAGRGLAIDPRADFFSQMGVNQISQSINARRMAQGIAPLAPAEADREAVRIQNEIRSNPLVAAAVESWSASHEAALELNKSIDGLEKRGLPAARERERQERERADSLERFQSSSGRRSAMASIERGMMSDPMQRAMSVFDDFQKNVETIAGGGGGPEEIMAAGGLFQNQLDALAKDNKPQFRPGMTGFSEFGQQFQQALFQDPAEKDRKEQLRLQREANDYAKQMAESLAGGLVSGPALFGGGGGN